MFSDDASLEAGLESNELYMTSNEPSTPYPSLAHTETCSRYFPAEEHEGDLLSSLELSPRLLGLPFVNRSDSDPLLLDPEPSLDLEELDRCLELILHANEPQNDQSSFDSQVGSTVLIEPLQEEGLLDAFFALVKAAHA